MDQGTAWTQGAARPFLSARLGHRSSRRPSCTRGAADGRAPAQIRPNKDAVASSSRMYGATDCAGASHSQPVDPTGLVNSRARARRPRRRARSVSPPSHGESRSRSRELGHAPTAVEATEARAGPELTSEPLFAGPHLRLRRPPSRPSSTTCSTWRQLWPHGGRGLGLGRGRAELLKTLNFIEPGQAMYTSNEVLPERRTRMIAAPSPSGWTRRRCSRSQPRGA